MADNILIASKINPVKFIRSDYVNPAPYNSRYPDDYLYQDTVRSFEQFADYTQPWQKNDAIVLQFLTNYEPLTLELLDCNGVVVVGPTTFDQKPNSLDLTGLKTWEQTLALDAVSEGYYQLRLTAGTTVKEILLSEWLDIRTLHENSVQLKYRHSKNDFNTAFETGVTFYARIFGGLKDYQPGAEKQVFIDQPGNAVLLDSRPFSTEKLVIGGPEGVPQWQIDWLMHLLSCDQVYIDGKRYTVTQNSTFEAVREDNYPMAGYSIELRRVDNYAGSKYVKSGGSSGPLTTLIYNIETRGFGPITGPASDNTIQIIAD